MSLLVPLLDLIISDFFLAKSCEEELGDFLSSRSDDNDSLDNIMFSRSLFLILFFGLAGKLL